MVKRIDFHIHTVPSIKDSDFNFSIEWLKAYVDKTKLDAIAITNHDLFDKNNFEEISEYLPNVKVYPGIELALDIGHVNIVIIHSFRFTQGTTLNEKVQYSLFWTIIKVRRPITTTNHGEVIK
ncbi:TPA: hypothetical protein ACGO5D_001948, partial [Streptococcus suis]